MSEPFEVPEDYVDGAEAMPAGAASADYAERLQELAQKIVDNHEKSDSHIVTAALAVVEAKRLFKSSDELTWADWCKENLKLGKSRVKELLEIGKPGDHQKALKEVRRKTAARVQKAREARAAAQARKADEVKTSDPKAQPLRSGHVDPELPPERSALIDWAMQAPIEAVSSVLEQALALYKPQPPSAS